jgi:hypothetical protein
MSRAHLTADDCGRYLWRTASADELLRNSDHLAACTECREVLRQMAEKHGPKSEGASVSYEELSDFLDQKLDPIERRKISGRLARSPASAAELKDLARFRDEMNTSEETKIVAFPRRVARVLLPLAAGLLVAAIAIWFIPRQHRDVTLRDGDREIVVARNGSVIGLHGVPEELIPSIASAVHRGKIEISRAIDSLASERETLAGAPNDSAKFTVISPIATALSEATPQFKWSAHPKATSYRIHIVDSQTGEVVLSGNSNQAETIWTATESLAPGVVYEWQVEALRGADVIGRAPEPPASEARFQILATDVQQKLAQTCMETNGSHLIMAVANAKAGALDDAERELRAFAQENPKSKIPVELIAQIEMARRGEISRQSPIATNGAQ